MSHSTMILGRKGFYGSFFTLIVLLTAVFVGSGLKVLSTSWAFHSEYCGYNTWLSGTNSITCTFATPQSGVLRHEASLAEVYKPPNKDIAFSVSSSLSVSPSASVSISVNNLGSATLKLGFFMLVIKNQPTTQYIQFVTLFLPFPSNISDSSNSVRYYFVDANINTLTAMTTTDINNLKIIPFVTCYQLELATGISNTLGSEYTYMFNFDYTIQSSSTLRMKVTIEPTIGMSRFVGSMILVNFQQIQAEKLAYQSNPTLTATDWLTKQYVIGDATVSGKLANVNFLGDFSLFGTSFNCKCILGFQKISYTKLTEFEFKLGKNSFNNYDSFSQALSSTGTSIIPEITLNFLCYGMNKECSDSSSYYDVLDTNCYTSSTCPLPVPGPANTWPHTNICPWCQDLICRTCTLADRSECVTCSPGSNSVLNTGTNVCDCLSGYYPVKIDLSPVTWNSAIQSTILCSLNCTARYTGCDLNGCDTTKCLNCLFDHMFVNQAVGDPLCTPCTTIQAHCLKCSRIDFCDTCMYGYYVVDISTGTPSAVTSSQCQPCLLNCKQCQNTTNCKVCFDGYKLSNSDTQCLCDPTLANLMNCQACNVNTTCTTCNTNFYVASATGLCEPCIKIHPQCNACSVQGICLACNVGYGLETVTPINTVCALCNKIVTYCDDCKFVNTCLHCVAPYGLASPSQCMYCELLKATGCIECTSSTAPCTKCTSTAYLLNGTCFFCPIFHNLCISCQADQTLQTLQCVQCQPGFYVGLSKITNRKECLPCPKAMHKCLQCSSQSFCTRCEFPNKLGSTSHCTECQDPYVNYDGVCMKLAGCINALELYPGTMTCLACNDTIHFVFQSVANNCICGHGYYENIAPELDQKCQPICSDGILITPDEQCDDGNLIDYDGCSKNCNKENYFNCDQLSPTKCVLERDITLFQFSYAERIDAQNKAILYFQILPKEVGLSTLDWSKFITLNFSSQAISKSSLTFHYSTSTGMLEVYFPYNETVQNSLLTYEVKLDATMIKSAQSFFKDTAQIKGANFPLIVESTQLLNHSNYISLIAMILSVLALVQFYFGSYLGKMIGLQTIYIFQLAFFARFLVFTKTTTLLNALDGLSYSSSGYSNPSVIFGEKDVTQHKILSAQFNKINLQKYFLLNINFWLIPIVLVAFVYLVVSVRKYFQWKAMIDGKDPGAKHKYILTQRSLQYIYDQCIFPQVMMIATLVHFNDLLCFVTEDNSDSNLSENSQSTTSSNDSIQTLSWAFQSLLRYSASALLAFEIISSLKKFIKPQLSDSEMSFQEKLQLDENSPHRPNYHSLYIFVYFLYYFTLSLVMSVDIQIGSITYGLQISFMLALFYFLFICYWSPYFKVINIHNIFLKVNHCVSVIILAIYEVFNKSSSTIAPKTLIIIAYVVLSLLSIVLLGGFVRIYFQHIYRKKLSIKINQGKTKPTLSQEEEPLKIISKKKRQQQMLENNKFTIKNQLADFKKTYYNNLGQNNLLSESVTKEEESFFMNKIKEEFQQKNFIYHDFWGKNNLNQPLVGQMSKPAKPIDQKIQPIHEPESTKAESNEPVPAIEIQLFPIPKPKHSDKEKEALLQLKRKMRSELIQMDDAE